MQLITRNTMMVLALFYVVNNRKKNRVLMLDVINFEQFFAMTLPKNWATKLKFVMSIADQ